MRQIMSHAFSHTLEASMILDEARVICMRCAKTNAFDKTIKHLIEKELWFRKELEELFG